MMLSAVAVGVEVKTMYITRAAEDTVKKTAAPFPVLLVTGLRQIGKSTLFEHLAEPEYPNGFASGKPADYFSEKQAREALHAADNIIRFCESFFSQSP